MRRSIQTIVIRTSETFPMPLGGSSVKENSCQNIRLVINPLKP